MTRHLRRTFHHALATSVLLGLTAARVLAADGDGTDPQLVDPSTAGETLVLALLGFAVISILASIEATGRRARRWRHA